MARQGQTLTDDGETWYNAGMIRKSSLGFPVCKTQCRDYGNDVGGKWHFVFSFSEVCSVWRVGRTVTYQWRSLLGTDYLGTTETNTTWTALYPGSPSHGQLNKKQCEKQWIKRLYG
ncbi:hypothetical protein LZ32DRAFT_385345 [Colletotrichum eremochloae]|nr:hypothetical protein LZ32DRAFT_385345 [Colletotrichum eremochloae]